MSKLESILLKDMNRSIDLMVMPHEQGHFVAVLTGNNGHLVEAEGVSIEEALNALNEDIANLVEVEGGDMEDALIALGENRRLQA